MAAVNTPILFAWNSPDQMPGLHTLIAMLDILPYDELCRQAKSSENG